MSSIHSRLFAIPLKYRRLNPVLVLSAGFTLFYLDTIIKIVKNWFTHEGSYGFFILASIVFMIWSKRRRLHFLSVNPRILTGSIVIVLGGFLFLAGKFSSTFMLQGIALILTLLGLILVIFGYPYLKELWLPLAYLVAMFGLFEEMLGNISPQLQYVTALIAYSLLKLTSMPVFLSGHVIQLPHLTLEVVKACNGINHIIALVALSFPLSFLTQQSWQKKVVLVSSALFIGIFTNGLRIALIGVWTTHKMGNFLHGPFDIFYVSFVFFFGVVLLVLVNILLARKGKNVRLTLTPMLSKSSNEDLSQPFNLRRQTETDIKSKTSLLKGTTVSITIMLIIFCYAQFYKPKPIDLETPLTMFPKDVGDWKGHDLTELGQPLDRLSPDEVLRRAYQDSLGRKMKVYVGYFGSQNQGRIKMDYRLGRFFHNAQTVLIPYENGAVKIKQMLSTEMDRKRTIYFWFDINGRVLADRYQTKLATIIDSFAKGRNNGALVVVFDDNDIENQDSQGEDLEFVRCVFPVIKTHLRTLSQ